MANNEVSNGNAGGALPLEFSANVRPISPKDNLVGFASVKINDQFVVNGIKIVTGKNGLFIDMPSAKDGKGGYRDVCFPTSKESLGKLTGVVLSEYAATVERMSTTFKEAEKATRNAPDKASISGMISEGIEKAKNHVRTGAAPQRTATELG